MPTVLKVMPKQKKQLGIDDLEADLQKLLKKFYDLDTDELCEGALDAALTIIEVLGPVTKTKTK